LSKIETGQLDMSLIDIDSTQALGEYLALVQPPAYHNEITLTVSDEFSEDRLVRAGMNYLK
jgi:hypothetical protein